MFKIGDFGWEDDLIICFETLTEPRTGSRMVDRILVGLIRLVVAFEAVFRVHFKNIWGEVSWEILNRII